MQQFGERMNKLEIEITKLNTINKKDNANMIWKLVENNDILMWKMMEIEYKHTKMINACNEETIKNSEKLKT